MNKSVMRFAALAGATALVFAGPVGAAKKTTKKTTKKVAPTTAAPTTVAPAPTAAPVTTAAPTVVAKPTGAAVKIGFLSAETGNASSAYKNGVGVVNTWAKWVNAEMGGIGGRPVEIVSADDKNTGADALAAGKDLVESKNVIAIIIQDSTAETALSSYMTDKKFPVIGGSANQALSGVGHGTSPYWFPTATGGTAGAESPAIIANKLGQGPLTTAVCGEVPACAAGSILSANKAKEFGLAYAGNIPVLGSSPNYTAECLEVQSRIAASTRSAGYVSIALAPTAMARFIKDCIRQGYQGYFGSSANTSSAPILETLDGIRVAGFVNGFPWWSDAAPVKNYRDVMKKYDAKQEYRDPTSTSSWAALELFRKTMNKAGAPASKDDVLKAYWNIKDENLDGLLPKTTTYSEGKNQTLVNCYWPYTFLNGKFTQLLLDGTKTGNGQTGDLRTYCG
jgi:branched-chain amino acid transport system substrate-binding protein